MLERKLTGDEDLQGVWPIPAYLNEASIGVEYSQACWVLMPSPVTVSEVCRPSPKRAHASFHFKPIFHPLAISVGESISIFIENHK